MDRKENFCLRQRGASGLAIIEKSSCSFQWRNLRDFSHIREHATSKTKVEYTRQRKGYSRCCNFKKVTVNPVQASGLIERETIETGEDKILCNQGGIEKGAMPHGSFELTKLVK